MKVFPTCLFSPSDQDARIVRRTVSGGESISGVTDEIATDGGGLVSYSIDDAYLDEPEVALAWRALDAYLDGGARAIIVPFCDARHQPVVDSTTTTHSDGTTFSDETPYVSNGAHGTAAVAASLRATILTINIVEIGRPLVGGEWFSIDHPTWRWRAYRIAEVLQQTSTQVQVSFRTPLREAVSVGEIVDFQDPRCTMKPVGGMPSPTNLGFASGGASFVEDLSGSYT